MSGRGILTVRDLGAGLICAALAVTLAPAPLAAVSTGTVRPPVERKDGRPLADAQPIVRGDEDVAALADLRRLRAKGLPFAEHELEILDAWEAGMPVAGIEAETLLSGAIYRLFVEGSPASAADRDLIRRWRAYRAEHTLEILTRAVELTGGQPDSVQPPDGSRDWDLYWDPELYNQLSSAYQLRLQRIYGFRGKLRRPAAPATGAASATGAPSQPNAAIVNVLVNDPTADATTQDTQSETGLVLGASGAVLASFNDSGSDLAPNPSFTGIARSTDGGATFTDQGRLPATATSDAGDPVLARNNVTGRIFLSTLGFNSGAVLQCFRSDDNGATYQPPVDCDGGGTSNDKEWITVDNAAGSGQGNVYHFYRDFGGGGGMSFVRSTDGGATWSSKLVLASGSGQGAWPVTGADHAVYAFWLATGNILTVRKSTDQGVTFAAAVGAQTLRTTGVNGDFGFTGGFRSNAFPQIVAHPTDASQLYMVWTDKAVSPSPDKANVYFSQSTSGGATWGAAVQVNTDAGTNDNWQPVIAITPDGTKLFVSWYDRRLDPGNSTIDVYARIATISGSTVTFGNDFRMTDQSFPVVVGQDSVIVATYMGDYDSAVADNAKFYRTWGDNRLPRLTHAHQPDVRFAAVPVTGPGAITGAGGFSLVTEGCAPANLAVDPNETVTVSFAVTNIGTAPTINLVGTLLATGGVLSPSGPQNYGAIAASATVSRSFTFTAGNLACGANVIASLQLQDGAENLGTVTYTIALGALGAPVSATYSSGNIAVPIPDSGNMVDQILAVPDTGAVSDVNVSVRLNHTFDGDLVISAMAPDGFTSTLVNRRGGSGDNFGTGATDCSGTPTVLDDEAGTPIASGAAPFAGSFIPDSSLSALDGRAVAGNWTFKINDAAAQDAGTLFCWQLEIVRNAYVCNASCGGTIIFNNGFDAGSSCLWSASVGGGC